MQAKRKAGGEGGQDTTALYVGDLPETWKADDIKELHRTIGLGEGGIKEVKLLPKRLPGETGCAILRYEDAMSAARALAVLQGSPVETASGQQKGLRVRYADLPPKAAKAARGNDWAPGFGTVARAPPVAWGAAPQPSVAPWGAWPQQQAPLQSQQHLPSVYLSEVPAEFTEHSIHAFHASLGLGTLAGVKFLPRKISGMTGSVMLRYSTADAAHRAVQKLQGHPINLSTGAVKYLVAKLADPPKGEAAEVFTTAPPAAAAARGPPPEAPPAGCDPCSLYLADVPSGLDKDAMRRLHQDSGLEPPTTVKYLPQKLDGETCCVILRYGDPESASGALHLLHSLSAKTQSGKHKLITARYASLKRGDEGQDDGQAPPTARNASYQYNGGHDWPSQPTGTGEDDSTLPSAYVSDLPGEITEDGLRQLLAETGVDPGLLVCAKFLPRKIQVNSICAMLRCNDMSGVNEFVNALNGYQVILPNGQMRRLIARVAAPPRSGGGGKGGGHMPVPALPVAEPTELYISEVPVDWNEDSLVNLHTECGLDPSSVTNIKMLHRRHSEYPTGSAIVRYVDHVSASTAMTLLQGRPMSIPGGQRQLVIRFADPPKKGR